MRFKDTYFFRCANNPYVRFPKPWDTYFTLPVSVPVSELLCKTKLKPNTISVISLLISILAAMFFYFGDHLSLAAGAVLFYISYVLDCADGYVARKNKLSSSLGHWIDHVFDEFKKPILLIALLIGQYRLDTVTNWGWIACVLYIFSRVLVKTDSTVKSGLNERRSDVKPTGESGMMLAPRQQWLFEKFGIVVLFTSIEAQSIAFIVGPIVGFPLHGVLVAAVLSLCWFIYVDGIRFWARYHRAPAS